ncbi:probable ATP-dependent kinase Tda10p [[Candida] railenensis]|uniref:Probable ATP-dependent kinase Tda10p n=1 Tax=[Candida] railenensis TaxID=45579 RepID=A0A9P0VXJ4_9ASCO|nr:probable ATP-dependent kinase Tda10p [[Candida] railenensis]
MTSLSKSVDYVSDIIQRDILKQKYAKPIVIGVSGPQGSGKTYLAEHLVSEIAQKFPDLNCVKFSMDDLYLTNSDQRHLTNEAVKDDNKLLQGRGLPGTHDIGVGLELFSKLISGEPVAIPIYDKSAFNGEGDRSTSSIPIAKKADLVIFEGWFNGYIPLDDDLVRIKWLSSLLDPHSCLKIHKLYQIEDINEKLKNYAVLWDYFDYFIYIETDYQNVGKWRLEQEHALIKMTGSGMSDVQVGQFIERYMPIYELFYEKLCAEGVCKKKGHNLKLRLSETRDVLESNIF